MKKRFSQLCFLAVLLVVGGVVLAHPALALETGIEQGGAFQQALGLGSGDIRLIIASIIRAILGFTGIIAVIMILYGGFLWMTAAGNDERVNKARGVLINAAVGLTIVLASYAITQFVINRLAEATGLQVSTGQISGTGGTTGGGPVSTSSVFVVEGVSPQGDQDIKNLSVKITFNKKVDSDTAADNVSVSESASGQSVDGEISVSGKKITFVPSAVCEEDPTENCFDANTTYEISIGSGMTSTGGKSISCGGFYEACTYEFTSGELVDTEDPAVTMSYPDDGDGVEDGTMVSLQAVAVDDSGISLVEFYVDGELVGSDQPAETSAEFNAESEWNASNLQLGEEYGIFAIAYDLNDHVAQSATIDVIVRPAHCFDGQTNADEEGEDCGGEDCGSCSGSSCVENADCASGVCDNGSCVDAPEIVDITPANGAPGTYVTVSGNNFGSGTGTVFFADTEAEPASCSDPWDTDQVVVRVPESLTVGESYPITIITSDGIEDSTGDNNGSLVDDFEVNSTERPGICELSPDNGEVGDIISVAGVNFGDTQGDAAVYFETSEAGAYSNWGDSEIQASVPSLTAAEYNLSIWRDGVQSNEVVFEVKDADSGSTPTIGSVSPESGPVGEYITISGSSFGSSIGVVYFTNTDQNSADFGVETVADTDFPDACEDDYWSRGQVTVKVPDGLEETDYNIFLTRQDGQSSNTIDFTVQSGNPGPGICSIDPDAAPIGYEGVVFYGDNFGSSEGSVTFYDNTTAQATAWSDSEITVNVPESASTGPLKVTDSAGNESNEVNFEIGNCNTEDICDANTQQCCSSGACLSADESCPEDEEAIAAAYVWEFSTGTIPEEPNLEVECSDDIISPTPWSRRSGGSEVCVNAAISATFDLAMDQNSFNSDSVVLEKCVADGEDACAETTQIELGEFSTTSKSFTVAPSLVLDTSSTYKVTLSSAIESSSGASFTGAGWQFGTRDSADLCTIAAVNLSPAKEVLESSGETASFNAQAVSEDACVLLDSSDYTWDYEIDGSIATLADDADEECTGSPSSCQVVEALQEGETELTATEQSEQLSDTADVVVNFTDPYVDNFWPTSSCSEACVNAEIGAEFNVAMKEESVLSSGAAVLYECADGEFCESYTDSAGEDAGVSLSDDGTELTITPADDLSANTYYLVVLSGEMTSTSGVALSEQEGSEFSWSFKTRDDEQPCAVERVELNPDEVRLDYIGARATIAGTAYGVADGCSSNGQKLTASDYDWGWSVADETIAELYANGEVSLATDSIADGCSSLCTAAGTESYTAVCGQDADGDGSLLDPGEDCDDGNTEDGDGCSSACLNEGTTACVTSADPSCCGNGIVDPAEECDDGGTESGDGCSSACLNEGSRNAGLTCGDGVVTQSTTSGGEECDTADSATSEGCTSNCLHQGSSAVETGICGDGTVDSPAEECDDGNTTDNDGCSSSCLNEGTSACAGSGDVNCCGNGVQDSYESCDDGNTTDSDGCSSACLLEGSSSGYDTPSFCGDAVVGTGEDSACEVDSGDLDGLIEPFVLSVVADTAPASVSDGEASTTITGQAEGEEGESNFVVECSCESDGDCADADALGCGSNGCCFSRPEITDYTPTADASAGETVCRNTKISLTFSDDMDQSSFDDNIKVALMADTGDPTATCPYESTVAYRGNNILARIWHALKRFLVRIIRPIFAQSVSALGEDCLLPISYSVSDTGDGQKITLVYDQLLEDNAIYQVMVSGDADHSGAGARSQYDVGLADDWSSMLLTGSSACELSVVSVEDTDEDSPNYFSQAGEEHNFSATALTRLSDGSFEEIESIPGVYEWDWNQTWWSTDEDVLTVDNSADSEGDDAVVAAVGSNGNASIYASATITVDSLFNSVDETVNDSSRATANLCENTWPAIVTGEDWTAFADDPDFDLDPDDDGIDEVTDDPDGDGSAEGYMHFSTYYCRDAGDQGTDDDLPALDAVTIPSPPGNVLKEFLLKADAPDGIGVRVASNTDLLSINEWYDDQGFTGSPSSTTVDGFEALQDGRTVYVNATNVTDSGDIYANVYALSYNEGASNDTIEIFDQLLENWNFVTNLNDDRICYESTDSSAEAVFDSDGSTIECDSDFDCTEGVCRAEKTKLKRDLKRLTDLNDIAIALDSYGESNGRCSATVATSCTDDSQCPSGESCEQIYPTLDSGTFLRSMTASAQDSWTSAFGETLGVDIPTDPLNQYVECGETDGTYESYDATTCWNSVESKYVCPEGSHVYFYRNIGGTEYELETDLEFDNYSQYEWAIDLDENSNSDGLTVLAGSAFTSSSVSGYQEDSVCDGSEFGASETCGDGVIGGSEICEVGDTSSDSCTALVCDSSDSDYDGKSCIVDCDDATICSGGDADEDGICDSGLAGGLYCDTGSVDCTDTTICDAGTTTATGTQTTTCVSSGADACIDYQLAGGAECVPGRCGNGVTEGTEECDDGTKNGAYGYCGSDCTISSGFYCGDATLAGGEVCDCGDDASGTASGGGACAVANGVYYSSSSSTCSNTCDGIGPSCGDGTVNGSEECESDDTDEWAGALCCGGDDNGEQCESDDDCGGGGSCGDSGSCSAAYDACADETDTDTGITYSTTRVRSCDSSCDWDASWAATSCTRDGECGNGIQEGDEECDDGNTSDNDACTTECKANVCGDGYLYSGNESCDRGDENGVECEAEYGSTCQYCSSSCTYLSSSGDFCGDGQLDSDNEYCDGSLLSINRCVYYWSSSVGSVCDSDADCTEFGSGTCTNVGLCNGGSNAGGACITDSACGGGDCVLPTCDASCGSTCPFTYDDSAVSITSEEAGATARTSLSLYNQGTGEGSPDKATLTIPACAYANSLTADISQENRNFPDVDIMLLLDESQSMTNTFSSGETRLEVLEEAVGNAIDQLFDAYESVEADMQIGYAVFGGHHGEDSDSSGSYESSNSSGSDEFTNFVKMEPVGSSDESSLLSSIDSDLADVADKAGTPLYKAISDATLVLNDSLADEKYMIIFTDGNIWNQSTELNKLTTEYGISSNSDYVGLVTDITDEAKDNGIEVFTAVLTSTTCDINQMDHWSSNSCTSSGSSCSGSRSEGNVSCEVNEDNGIQYAYDTTEADELQDMYDEIVNAILNITVTIEDADGNMETDTIEAGQDVSLPLPSAFLCDAESEQDTNIEVSFGGSGTINFSDITLNMCSP